MDKDGRSSPRIAVSIKMACEDAEGGALRLLDLSAGGFLARGRIASKAGDALVGTVHVFPASGDSDVTVRGSVVRALPDGDELVLGVKIESFGSAEGEQAYLTFVRELHEND